MSDKKDAYRMLPKMDALLESPEAARHVPLLGRKRVLEICRAAVEEAKGRIERDGTAPKLEEIEAAVADELRRGRSDILGRVLNGTGVLLHTNMGRSPLGEEIFEEIKAAVGGYCNLEINILERRRGVRGPQVSSLLAQACGAEAAVVVNNNAAAVMLLLRELAVGKRVVISRGELIQIGGGFRIPDIMATSGATLVEVGTTNITSKNDYAAALGPDTAMMLKVHHANFRMEGFVESPSVKDLAALKSDDTLLVCDIGSGNLVRSLNGIDIHEPTPESMLAAGADLVSFSCDKMLGGVQGGVIAGRADLVRRISKNPLMRAVRVDKVTYAALQAVLTRHLAGRHADVTLWGMASATQDEVRARATRFIEENGLRKDVFSVVDSNATFGGGSTPGEVIPSAAIRITSTMTPDATARLFQKEEPPLVGVVKDDLFAVDMRTILPMDEPLLAATLKRFEATLPQQP